MPAFHYPFDTFYKLSTIRNRQHPLRRITPPQLVLYMTTSIKNNPKRGICDTIGFAIARLNNNLIFTGTKASTMKLIITQNITQQPYIERKDHDISRIKYNTSLFWFNPTSTNTIRSCTLACALRGCLDPVLLDHGQTTDDITR